MKEFNNRSNEKIKTTTNCFFCNVFNRSIQAKIVADYDYCYVMEDSYPVSKGHLLIISKNHVENWFAANMKIKENIIKALDEVKIHLDKQHHPDGYNIGINCGIDAGQTINHLHLHLIPRYYGDVENPHGGVRGVIPSKQKY